MRRFGLGVLVFVLCLPLIFTSYLLFAARNPAFDRLTLTLPMAVRQPVAEVALRYDLGKDYLKKIDRVLILDPENADAWSQRCSAGLDPSQPNRIATCNHAIGLNPTAWNYNGLGLAQQDAKDFCAAENSFTMAIRKAQNDSGLLRNMGIAALRCGHIGAGQAGLEVAEGLDAKDAANPDSADDESKDNLALDREYLAVVYDRNHEPGKAAEACAKAHAGWNPCHCELTEKSVICSSDANVGLRQNRDRTQAARYQ